MIEDDILDALDGLGYPIPINSRDDLNRIVSGEILSKEFTNLIAWLSSELRIFCSLNEQINVVENANHIDSFCLETSSFLKELDCPYSLLNTGNVNDRLRTSQSRLLLVDFLRSELQAARIICVNASKSSKDPYNLASRTAAVHLVDTGRSPADCLKNTMKSLGFARPPDGITPVLLFKKLCDKLSERLKVLPKEPALFRGNLNIAQWKSLQKLNNSMISEYSLRARLLLTRLDVTIRSFVWSDRIKKIEDSIFKVYNPLRDKLHSGSLISISDLLAARIDLLLIEKTSNSSIVATSKMNKVLMLGRVPDRGGRPTEIQAPPPEMPSWKKDRAPMPQRGTGGVRGQSWRGQSNGGQNYGGSNYGNQNPSFSHQPNYQYQQQNCQASYQQQQQAPSYGGYSGQQAFYSQDSYGDGQTFHNYRDGTYRSGPKRGRRY